MEGDISNQFNCSQFSCEIYNIVKEYMFMWIFYYLTFDCFLYWNINNLVLVCIINSSVFRAKRLNSEARGINDL